MTDKQLPEQEWRANTADFPFHETVAIGDKMALALDALRAENGRLKAVVNLGLSKFCDPHNVAHDPGAALYQRQARAALKGERKGPPTPTQPEPAQTAAGEIPVVTFRVITKPDMDKGSRYVVEFPARPDFNNGGGGAWFAEDEAGAAHACAWSLSLFWEWCQIQLRAALARAKEAEAKLPDGMKHCTIRFVECEKGHGRLTATNWVDHGCPTCAIAAVESARDEAQSALDALRKRLREAPAEMVDECAIASGSRDANHIRAVLRTAADWPEPTEPHIPHDAPSATREAMRREQAVARVQAAMKGGKGT